MENIGVYDAGLHNDGKQKFYKSADTVDLIVTNISQELRVALTALDGGGKYNAVDNIRVIVKQQTVHLRRGLIKPVHAGALTNSTVNAMKKICEKVINEESNLLARNNTV